MSALVDARPVVEAIRTAIEAQLGGWQVYDYGQVPGADGNTGTLPNIYALLAVERRGNPQVRASARTTRTGWRFTVRVVGRTVNEARWALAKVAGAVNEAILVVGDEQTTPIQFERDQAPELDEGRYTALSSWTLAI